MDVSAVPVSCIAIATRLVDMRSVSADHVTAADIERLARLVTDIRNAAASLTGRARTPVNELFVRQILANRLGLLGYQCQDMKMRVRQHEGKYGPPSANIRVLGDLSDTIDTAARDEGTRDLDSDYLRSLHDWRMRMHAMADDKVWDICDLIARYHPQHAVPEESEFPANDPPPFPPRFLEHWRAQSAASPPPPYDDCVEDLPPPPFADAMRMNLEDMPPPYAEGPSGADAGAGEGGTFEQRTLRES